MSPVPSGERTNFSDSEEHGIAHLKPEALSVYSVGVSTGGEAEIRMARFLSNRHIIATTIDSGGLDYARQTISERGLQDQIDLKYENVAEPLPYADNTFDYIYARLVLHYLPKDQLTGALSELHRVLRFNGGIFIVVRSDKCEHAHLPDSAYDSETELTEYTETNQKGETFRLKRHFFSEPDLVANVEQAGFKVDYATSFDEHLYKDFMRTVPDSRTDNLVELLATKPDSK